MYITLAYKPVLIFLFCYMLYRIAQCCQYNTRSLLTRKQEWDGDFFGVTAVYSFSSQWLGREGRYWMNRILWQEK